MAEALSTTILQDELPGLIHLYDIDLSLAGLPIYYLTPSIRTSSVILATHVEVINGVEVTIPSKTYLPYDISIEGIDFNSMGDLSRPKLTVANVDNFFGKLSFLYTDLVGCRVSYRETFANLYPLGLTAPPIHFTIGKKLAHNRHGLSYELRSLLDKERLKMPKNQMLQSQYPGLGANKHLV